MRDIKHFTRIKIASLVLLVGAGGVSCSSGGGGDSKLRIRFPEKPASSDASSEASLGRAAVESVKGLSATLDRLCFVVNVTGEGIKDSPAASSCTIATGLFSGSVPPGGEISLVVPRGSNRRLEVFAYQRNSSTEACPSLQIGFGSLDPKKIARIGEVPSFDALSPVVDLSVSVHWPDGANLVTQYGLANSCGAQTAVGDRPVPSLASGLRQGTGAGGYVIRSGVGAVVGTNVGTGTGGWTVRANLRGVAK